MWIGMRGTGVDRWVGEGGAVVAVNGFGATASGPETPPPPEEPSGNGEEKRRGRASKQP